MKVEQFYNKNQFHLWDIKKPIDFLQSYNSLVVKIEHKTIKNTTKRIITLGRDWDYSTTTSKHVYLFLEEYGNISFYGITNKRKYIQQLIDTKEIIYDEKMI